MVKLKNCRGRKSQVVFSNQVMTNPCCGLAVIFCGFISHLIGRETINIPEIYNFTGKTAMFLKHTMYCTVPDYRTSMITALLWTST